MVPELQLLLLEEPHLQPLLPPLPPSPQQLLLLLLLILAPWSLEPELSTLAVLANALAYVVSLHSPTLLFKVSVLSAVFQVRFP
jgi:hypothetical protein